MGVRKTHGKGRKDLLRNFNWGRSDINFFFLKTADNRPLVKGGTIQEDQV